MKNNIASLNHALGIWKLIFHCRINFCSVAFKRVSLILYIIIFSFDTGSYKSVQTTFCLFTWCRNITNFNIYMVGKVCSRWRSVLDFHHILDRHVSKIPYKLNKCPFFHILVQFPTKNTKWKENMFSLPCHNYPLCLSVKKILIFSEMCGSNMKEYGKLKVVWTLFKTLHLETLHKKSLRW